MSNNKQYENLYFPNPVNLIMNVPVKYDLHWHKFTEILIYPQDAASRENPRILIDQNEYQMHPGDILFIWSSEMHSVERNTTGCLIGLQFPSTLLTDLPEFASFSHLFRTCHLLRHDDPQTASLTEDMHSRVQELIRLRKERALFHGVEELICLYHFFIHFGKHLQDTMLPREITNRQGNSRTIDKINQACRFITENCDRDLTLESVAEKVGFSACYFSRVFKQTINCNFVEYLTLQRLKRAQSMLADSDMAITSIAMESGFKSISTFNRVFQKYKGCAPSEFKKHYFH